MHQVIQSLSNGEIEVIDLPMPAGKAGQLVIRTRASLISAGTERMLLQFGRAGVIGKIRQQPDKVAQVLDKIRTDGLLSTLETVRNKLEFPITPGYCNVGRVLSCGDGVNGFAPGDRVVSNGSHADIVRVPQLLCAKVPDSVSDEEAVFAVPGAIALQGIRLIGPTLGEKVVVVGLGLIGLLAAQLLRANGCQVLGLDRNPARCALAEQMGVAAKTVSSSEESQAAAAAFSGGLGVDAVLIAAATQSSEPMHDAAVMCRQRGRIVLVGVTGLELRRDDFYKKEITFQVSSSYGPGRYDAAYEEEGHDYPRGLVRWTAQRNFEAVLACIAAGTVNVRPLITHRFPVTDARQAFDLLDSDAASFGILLEYADGETLPPRTVRLPAPPRPAPLSGKPTIAFIGAGSFGSAVLAPAFKQTGAKIHAIASTGGAGAHHMGRKTGAEILTTDLDGVFADPAIHGVVIATRHDSHAALVARALKAGKHVYVEKPLALTDQELAMLEEAHAAAPDRIVAVGFNRRHAPLVRKMHALLARRSAPRSILMTINAGTLPADHWLQDAAQGGGRILGEGCHFMDLSRYLADAPITSVTATPQRNGDGKLLDGATIQLGFANGSDATIHYWTNGARAFPKERIEAFSGGAVLQLDNYRALRGFGVVAPRSLLPSRQDKGFNASADAFIAAMTGDLSHVTPFAELAEISRATIAAAATLR